jgi:hypothetical protein
MAQPFGAADRNRELHYVVQRVAVASSSRTIFRT